MFEFKTALQLSKNSLQKSDPVFCNFILSIKYGRVNVLAVGDSCQIDIPVNPEGFDRLRDGLYLVPDSILGVVTVGDYAISTRPDVILLTSDQSSYEFNISPYSDTLPDVIEDSEVSVEFAPDRLSLALEGVSSLRGSDPTNPNLCGVNFSCDPDGRARLTATDGVCLATEVIEDSVEVFSSFTLPGSSIKVFKDVLDVTDSTVTLSVMCGDPVSVVKLVGRGVELTLSVLPGRDDYISIIPQFELNPYVFPITSDADVVGKLDRLSYVDIVDLVFSNNELRILGRSSKCSGVESVKFPGKDGGYLADHDSGNFEVAIVLTRLKALVKSLPSLDFFVRLRSPTSPILFASSESPDHYLDSLRLIMPVQRR